MSRSAPMSGDLNDRFQPVRPCVRPERCRPVFPCVRIYQGERLSLPLIDLSLTKENAMPDDLWGLIERDLEAPPGNGVSLFLQGLDKRGPDNRRKRIYMSALTPDLYRPMYGDKVTRFFDKLLDAGNAGKPLMRLPGRLFRPLLGSASGGQRRRDTRRSSTGSGRASTPSSPIAIRRFRKLSMTTTWWSLEPELPARRGSIDANCRFDDGKTATRRRPSPITGCGMPETDRISSTEDIVFECFHDFVAFSQWGNDDLQRHAETGHQRRTTPKPGLVQEDDGRQLRPGRRHRHSPRWSAS